MHEQTPRNLPWLDRLAAKLPGYGGYAKRAERRKADQVLRDAVADKLNGLKRRLEEAVRQCIDRGALTEINALERAEKHIERIVNRLHSAGSGSNDFYAADDLNPNKTDALYALDLALFDRADELERLFDAPDEHHDRMARIEAALNDFEAKLDERARLLLGIR